jgi:hypothetical protein
MILWANYLRKIHDLKCHCKNSSNDIVFTHFRLAFLDLSIRLVRILFFLCLLVHGSEIFFIGRLVVCLYRNLSIFIAQKTKNSYCRLNISALCVPRRLGVPLCCCLPFSYNNFLLLINFQFPNSKILLSTNLIGKFRV